MTTKVKAPDGGVIEVDETLVRSLAFQGYTKPNGKPLDVAPTVVPEVEEEPQAAPKATPRQVRTGRTASTATGSRTPASPGTAKG